MSTALHELRELERQNTVKQAPDVVLDTLEPLKNPPGPHQLRARQPPAHHRHPRPRRRHAPQQQLIHRDDDHLQAGPVRPSGRRAAAPASHAARAAGGAASLQQQQQLGCGQPGCHAHREDVPQQLSGQVGHHVTYRTGRHCPGPPCVARHG